MSKVLVEIILGIGYGCLVASCGISSGSWRLYAFILFAVAFIILGKAL